MAKSTDAGSFAGFSPEGMAFLSELGDRDRDWFVARRALYEAEVLEPAKAFVTAMTERLQAAISPGLIGVPKTNGSLGPIQNDRRFAKGKPPYKDHLLFRFWEGPDKKTAPTLFVRVSERSIGFASGAPFEAGAWREAVADDGRGGELARILTRLRKGRDLDVAGAATKRVPRPFSEDHPRADLLELKAGIQVRWPEPAPASLGSARFLGWCEQRLGLLAPMHRWLLAL